MASVQPPSSLRPASVQPPSSSFLPVSRRLNLMQIDLTWTEPVASSAGLPGPGRSLNQGTERGTSTMLREEKDPRGRCHPARLPLPVILRLPPSPPSINNNLQTPLRLDLPSGFMSPLSIADSSIDDQHVYCLRVSRRCDGLKRPTPHRSTFTSTSSQIPTD
ncbi:hypothetical protein D5F01_LYC24562 [Larimichthys crocea]|uniref:Uncharacterized protein n=1 Tax=Larimichthys crocea TaxID=215358 RepID=A0A6G0HE68_LARCR|nr:hypothetical protein D5F01_LYC24562 [Larimichthys crocea]